MLFIGINTWKPENRNEITKRRAEKGAMTPEGVTIKGEWVDVSGGRDILLMEADDAAAIIAQVFAWDDLMEIEAFPVMEVAPLMDIVTKML